MTLTRLAAALIVGLCLASVPVHAQEPIQITNGYVVIHKPLSGGDIQLDGSGFTFKGDLFTGWMGVFTSCLPCSPGAVINLDAHWVGLDLKGTAVHHGQVYPQVGSMSSLQSGSVSFRTQDVQVPADGLRATLTAPFVFDGEFRLGSTTVSVAGRGTVTAHISRASTSLPWTATGVSLYQFGSSPVSAAPSPAPCVIPTPTPAPAPVAPAPAPVTPPAPSTCTTGAPGLGWICVNGGWLPPGHPAIGSQPQPQPQPAPAPTVTGCSTPDPFVSIGGGVCANGGWTPR